MRVIWSSDSWHSDKKVSIDSMEVSILVPRDDCFHSTVANDESRVFVRELSILHQTSTMVKQTEERLVERFALKITIVLHTTLKNTAMLRKYSALLIEKTWKMTLICTLLLGNC